MAALSAITRPRKFFGRSRERPRCTALVDLPPGYQPPVWVTGEHSHSPQKRPATVRLRVSFVIHPAQAIRLFSPDRRMPAGAHPQTACVHSLGSVESQCFHSRSAGCRQANNRCPIRAPHKMFRPALTSWMIEGNGGIAFRIDPCCVDVFVPVAPRTGQTQIVQRIRAACPSGQDVVNGEDKASQPFGTLAIFAALPRPLTYFVSS